MTPRQLQSLYHAQEDLLAHQEFIAGVITSAVINFSMAAPKDPARPADLFGSRWAKKAKQGPTPQSAAFRLADQLKSLMAADKA